MHVIAQPGGHFDRLNNVPGEVARMRRCEAHSTQTGNLRNGYQKFRKRLLTNWIAVRIHVLPEELDLAVSAVSESTRFFENRVGSTTALFTPRVRNNAVRAELVAALDDRYVASVRVRADREWGIEGLVRLTVVESGYTSLPCFNLHQHLREIPVRS